MNCLWQPCLLMNRNKTSILYNAFYQISVHLGKRFQRRFFRNQPIRNKNCLWRPRLLTDQDEMSILYRGQVLQMLLTKFWFKWLVSFREEDFYKSTNKKQELPVAAMFVNRSGRNEQSLQKTFHRCFLPNFSSFGIAVSEEKIIQKSTNQKQEWPVVAIFVNRSGRYEHSLQRTFHKCFLPSFGSVGYAISEEKIFKNRPSRNKNGLWRSCSLIDRDKMSNLYTYRCVLPIFGSFGQVVSEEKNFF